MCTRACTQATPGTPPQLLQLPLAVLMRVFALLAPRERALAVCRRWVDVGLRAELWRGVRFDARGTRGSLCRRLDFAPSLRRLAISNRDDVNHILETVRAARAVRAGRRGRWFLPPGLSRCTRRRPCGGVPV